MIPPRVNRIRLPHPADPGEQRTVLAVLAAVLLLQIELVFSRPVNWDEFYHLSLVHAQAQGRMSEFLQVLHIRLLGWLPLLGLDEIGQIRAARLVMLGCELVTLTAIYALARRFAHRRLALLAPLLYLSAGFVFQHGMSFRADPLVTALLMGALWLLLTGRLRLAALASIALLLALAVLATIKAVLFAPAFAGIAWLRIQQAPNRRDTLVRMIAIGLFAAILLGLFTALVQMGAAPAAASSAKSTLSASGSMLLAEGLFPRWHYLLLAIGTAPVLAAAMAATVGLTGPPQRRCWSAHCTGRTDPAARQRGVLPQRLSLFLCLHSGTGRGGHTAGHRLAEPALCVARTGGGLLARLHSAQPDHPARCAGSTATGSGRGSPCLSAARALLRLQRHGQCLSQGQCVHDNVGPDPLSQRRAGKLCQRDGARDGAAAAHQQ
jgi:hypothetical protein